MAITIQFASADDTEWEERVTAALKAEYDDSQGHVVVGLHHRVDRGYQIVGAECLNPLDSIAMDPLVPVPPPLEDYTAQVRAVLQRIGAPLA